VEKRLRSTEATGETLATANLALNAVHEELRQAIRDQGDAVELMAEAMTRSNRATQALRRADELRASIVEQFHLPNLPPDDPMVKA
jgi:hypothetical protein